MMRVLCSFREGETSWSCSPSHSPHHLSWFAERNWGGGFSLSSLSPHLMKTGMVVCVSCVCVVCAVSIMLCYVVCVCVDFGGLWVLQKRQERREKEIRQSRFAKRRQALSHALSVFSPSFTCLFSLPVWKTSHLSFSFSCCRLDSLSLSSSYLLDERGEKVSAALPNQIAKYDRNSSLENHLQRWRLVSSLLPSLDREKSLISSNYLLTSHSLLFVRVLSSPSPFASRLTDWLFPSLLSCQ